MTLVADGKMTAELLPHPPGPPAEHEHSRVRVDGKFFRLGPAKFYVKGITYGPFAPDADGFTFGSREQAAIDFRRIVELGANVVRVYYVPPAWLLDLAEKHGLKLFIDIPWPKHLCFLDSAELRAEARQAVRAAARAGRGHPAIFAYSVVNEIPAEIVRWSGINAITRFIEELVAAGKAEDPEGLYTFTSFPPTEYLHPRNIDFVCFNVYLHDRLACESYLRRLQMLADSKPLLLGEFGIDSYREGEEQKCAALSWQIETAFRSGLAGTIIFSFTDDWWRGGFQVEDWAFGLTTRERQRKDSFRAVKEKFRAAPCFAFPRQPKVSVVVCSFNGAATLAKCLESLSRLNYPDYEVILVDDGSTDGTPELAPKFPSVRYLRQTNLGLSAARNAGIAAAQGEIIAFTDSDCRADEDWLYHLVGELVGGEFVGVGGHNFLPPEDSCVAAAVMASPGGPAHVMLSDREAEHIPGCNMAFFKWALQSIGGFDPMFRKAGDDVDVCWRLQERGFKLGFNPAGFVWHYRRSTVGAYLKQQQGYGEAEASLAGKHPEHFNSLGDGMWRGRIYTSANFGVLLGRPIIYHGLFGSGFFQKLYAPRPAHAVMLCTSLEYQLLITLPLLVASASFPGLLPVAITALALSVVVCATAAFQANLPKDKRCPWSRPLVGCLFFLQPLVRGYARYKWRLRRAQSPPRYRHDPLAANQEPADVLHYWSSQGPARYEFISRLAAQLERQGWLVRLDTGWGNHDLEVQGNQFSRLRLTAVTEDLGAGKHTYRWRLSASWSLRAKVAFALIAGIELLAIGWFASNQPWIWMLPLSLPFLSWHLEHEKRMLRQMITTQIHTLAEELQLVRFQPDPDRVPSRGDGQTRNSPIEQQLSANLGTASPRSTSEAAAQQG